jgi:uncharacterized protein with NRDE domain
MCLIVLAHQLNSDYPLIMAANRDEFRHRPTQNMHWWPNIQILAGKDLEAGGTWLAVHKNGRWAAVTNFRKVDVSKVITASGTDLTTLKSRGHLALNFLSQNNSAIDFANQLQMGQFAGFNLLLWDNHELVFCANEEQKQPRILAAGIYGLSNGRLDSDTRIATDPELPKTGISLAWERRLSACFIDAPEYIYGTRTCISMYRDKFGNMDIHETCFDTPTPQQQHFNWTNKSSCTPA